MQKKQTRSRTKFYVNGRYLGRPVTGVERFADGILQALDRLVPEETVDDWTVLVPPGLQVDPAFTRLRVRAFGHVKGHAWEQLDLLRASRDGVLINLCNSGPVLHPRQLTVIHDALVYRFPQGFSRAYRTLHRMLGRALARTSHLATVSNFSREELARVFGLSTSSIGIIPNAVDHLAGTVQDFGILDRLHLTQQKFLLFIGSPAPNKNLAAAVEAFRRLGRTDVAFVLVGAAAKSFAPVDAAHLPETCLRPGRLSDGEIKALYMRANALVFPSVYEGFGIPPLEAMSVSCPVLASDIAVVREVCADAALYFDPENVASISQAMALALDSDSLRRDKARLGTERAALFSWQTSARRLLEIVQTI